MIRRGLLGLVLFLATLSSAWAQCAPGVPCGGNPMGIPPDQPNSPYNTGQGGYGGQDAAPRQSQRAATWGAFGANSAAQFSWTFEQRSQSAAEHSVLDACKKAGGTDCQVIDTFSESCAAPAIDRENRLFMGQGYSPRDAEGFAIEKCDKAYPTGQCRLVSFAICTGSNYNERIEADASKRAAAATPEDLAKAGRSYRSGRAYWGAMVVGPRDNTVRLSVDERTQEEAEAHALARCQGGNCRVLASFKNTCVATGYPTDPAKNDEYLKPETNDDPNVLNRSLRAKCDARYGAGQCAVMVRCTGWQYPSIAPFATDSATAAKPAGQQRGQAEADDPPPTRTAQAGQAAPTAAPAPALAPAHAHGGPGSQAGSQPDPLPQSQPQPGPGSQRQAQGSSPLRASYRSCVAASGGVTVAVNDCIGTELKFQDARLNKAYGALRQTLDQPSMTRLRDEERAWISARDQQCQAAAGGGTAALLDSNACLLDLTAQRAVELEQMLAAR